MDSLPCNNLILAEKLRNEDPDQFYTLVKMHLSFVLDLNMDDSDVNTEKKARALKWNLPFSKKPKPYTKNCNEGSHLNTEFIEQIKLLINFLSLEDNISQEGIFRRSGKVTRQQELKALINQGVTINLSDGRFSVHDCATVLKNILSELPESVLTDAHYPAYCQIADLCNVKSVNNEDRLLKSIQLLILLLPSENRTFFQDIIALLHLAASHENKNRMSADNLATLFTPHLLCPRKLSPEAFHMNSQVMSRVVAFMIQKGAQLFEIPLTLATDLQAYSNKKERRKLSPLKQMNESVCDGTAANTIYTFVDRERTAQENGANPTETALAQLYAYIQSLPESSKKRKLIKQFNKENGYGTPLRALGGKKRTRSRSLGDSIKKHLPVFTKSVKRSANPLNYGEEECNSPIDEAPASRGAVDNVSLEKAKKSDSSIKQSVAKPTSVENTSGSSQISEGVEVLCQNEDVKLSCNNYKITQRCLSYEGIDQVVGSADDAAGTSNANGDGPGSEGFFVSKKRNSSSLIDTPSPSKVTCSVKNESVRIMQRDILRQWPVSKQIFHESEKFSDQSCNNNNNEVNRKSDSFVSTSNLVMNDPVLNGSHRTPCKTSSLRNLDSHGFVEPATILNNIAKTPVRKFSSNGNLPRNTNNDLFFSTPNTTTNRIPLRYCSKSHLLMTSTPAPGNGCIVTPIVDKNNSMSPITRSTQRMPKAMQETMMTPRSRKPVISLSGTDLCNLASMDSLSGEYPITEETPTGKIKKGKEYGKKLILEDTNEDENDTDSLSSTFRDYLFSRSVVTTSPVDLSFCSRTDDFLSISDENSSGENDDFKSLAGSILNEGALSDSLLYCLDGNEPGSKDVSGVTDCDEKPSDEGSSCATYSECTEGVNHVYETAL